MKNLDQNGLPSWTSQVPGLFDIDPGFSAFPRRQLLLDRKWTALPFELDFRGEGPRLVSNACQRYGFSTAVCMNIDANPDLTYKVDLGVDGLDSAHNTFHMPSYAIIEIGEHFLIVSDSDYYWSIIGDRPFVESVLEAPWYDLVSRFERGIAPYKDSARPDQRRIWRSLSNYAGLCRSTFMT